MKYIIEIDGRYWQVEDDGTLKELSVAEFLYAKGEEGNVVISANPDNSLNSTPEIDKNSGQFSADVNAVTSSTINLAIFFTKLNRDGNEQLPESGIDSDKGLGLFLQHQDLSFSQVSAPPPPLSDDAEISIFIDDHGDGFINRFEIPVVDISGDTLNLYDGQLLEVIITDAEGTSISFITVINNNRYELLARDISSLSEGPLTATATVSDAYGTSISAIDDTVVDTLADIDAMTILDDPNVVASADVPEAIWTDADESKAEDDGRINANQITASLISGHTSYINAGQTIKLTATDISGREVTAETTIQQDGSFHFNSEDLSVLSDGEIQVVLESTDIPGNPANNSFSFIKDVAASVGVEFDGDLNFSASETTAVSLSGTVNNIEVGQKIIVTISDGTNADIVYDIVTVQEDGSWITAERDLSALKDGEITATVQVIDVAGNVSVASNTAIIDRIVNIDIDTSSASIDITALRSSETLTMIGSTDAEVGQVVTLTFSDGHGSEQQFTTQVTAGGGNPYLNSWSTEVTIDSLSQHFEWTMQAEVTDIAGNTVADTPPSLVNSQTLHFDENDLVDNPAGFAQTTTIDVQEYQSVVFSLSQEHLTSIVSDGQNLIVSISPDRITARQHDGLDILEASINPDGTVTVTLLAPILDQDGVNEIIGAIRLDATQTSDADGTTETVTAEIPITIADSSVFTVANAYTVVELVPATGNVFENDNTLEGPLFIQGIQVEGQTIVVTETTPATVITSKGELTVYADGEWEFVSIRNLDNDALQQLEFIYQAVDADNDTSSSQVQININDGSGGVFPSASGTIIESDYDESQVESVSFMVRAGSDDLLAPSLRFSGSQLSILEDLNYTSDGQALVYSLSEDHILTAKTESSDDTVFTITLTATVVGDGSGNLNAQALFMQTLPLDHNISDSLSIPLAGVAEDHDGTLSEATSTLFIVDGNLPHGTAQDSEIFEADLPDAAAVVSASLSIQIGSDQVTDIGFIDSNSAQPTLFSSGNQIQYAVSADGLSLTGYTVEQGIDDPHFILTINGDVNSTTDSSLSYDFTLFNALDQLNSLGENTPAITPEFTYQLLDFDGDSTTNTIQITINDAGPIAIDDIDITVTETPKKLVNLLMPSSLSIDFVLDASKDAFNDSRIVLVNGAAVLDSAGVAVTQNDQALIWYQQDANSWFAQNVDGENVIAVTLPASISPTGLATTNVPLTVTVLQAIDQSDLPAANDAVRLAIPVEFIESDLTVSAATANITIIDGRNPVALGVQTLSVDEAQLTGGDFSSSASGLAYAFGGSDDLAAINIMLKSGQTLTSGGVPVSLAATANADGWWIATAGSDEVFRVRIDLDGSADFILSQALDHASADATNNLDVIFDVQVQDVDGDWSNTPEWTVKIQDDVPVGETFVKKLTEGSSKNFNILNDPEVQGADGAVASKIHYMGQEIAIPTAGSAFVDLKHTDIYGVEVTYGRITVHSTGEVLLEVTTTDSRSFEDIGVSIDVTDFDGDIANNPLVIDVKDERADISITGRVTQEDTPMVVNLLADPGDIDNGEVINTITFDNAQLLNGVLTLGGIALPLDGSGNPYLQFIDGDLVNSGLRYTDPQLVPGQMEPNGTLLFTPALNISDPTHNVKFDVEVAVTDNSGGQITSEQFNVSITPVVDAPSWDAGSQFHYTMDEDGVTPDLNISAVLFDTDGSEALMYRIENIEADLTLKYGDKTVTEGMTLNASQMALLFFTVPHNYAGQKQFDVIAIAEETSTSESSEITQTITIDVAPVADKAEFSTSNIFSLEDELIPLSSILSGDLTDIDGSENLFFEFDLPASWSIVDGSDMLPAGASVIGNTVRISAADILADTAFLKPKEDISTASDGGGIFEIPVRAITVESSADGIAPSLEETASADRIVKVEIQGTVDIPKILPDVGNTWSFDDGAQSLSAEFNEDQLLQMNFITGTEDDDNSERYDFILKNIPDDIILTDSSGQILSLNVVGQENGKPVYALSSTDLAQVYIKPTEDFSGLVSFDLIQTNTERDGDTDSFPIKVNLEVLPLVEPESELNLFDIARGSEDTGILLDIRPQYFDPNDPESRLNDLGDIDGSETLTNVIIQSIPAGAILLVDGTAIVSGAPFNLSDIAIANSLSFEQLIHEGHLRIQPPEDDGRDFQLSVTFEITDDSGTATDVASRPGTLYIDNWAIVDNDDPAGDGITRLEIPATPLVSTDGTAIDLTGMATFYEEDIDGSEWIDYISLSLPPGEWDGWYISHPTKDIINDGQGNWLMDASGMTDDAQGSTPDITALLDGITVVSDHVTGSGGIDLSIEVRVVDQHSSQTDRDYDADIIKGSINIVFEQPGELGSAEAIDELQQDDDIIDGKEHKDGDGSIPPVTISEHLNQAANGDANDDVSFRIDAKDRPYGGWFTGNDVITEYADDGTTVKAWVFTEDSLGSLNLVGQNEDFSGDMRILVHKISTDPLGDTTVSQEYLLFDIAPDVDDVDDSAQIEMIEDVPTRLQIDLDSLLNDKSTAANEGLETITSVTFSNLPSGASFWDPLGHLTEVDGNFMLADASLISQVFFIPPNNKHGEMTVDMELTIEDRTTGGSTSVNTDVQTKISTLTFNVIADTDVAIVIVKDHEGDEDSLIALDQLHVIDVDTDGSETLSLQLAGVPQGAVLFANNSIGEQEQLVNEGGNAVDGYTWSFNKEQLSSLVLQPPKDFSGDFDLTLISTSMELSTQQILMDQRSFNVAVHPIADGAIFKADLDDIVTDEGSSITIDINAQTQEAVNPNETVLISIQIDITKSDASLLSGLSGVRLLGTGQTSAFIVAGNIYTAVLLTNSASVKAIELLTGGDAFGHLDVTITVGSADSALVNGVLETDLLGDNISAETISIDISPTADAPIIGLTSNHISAATGQIPLGIELTIIAPAPGETSELIISGLPEGVTVNGATQSGNRWIADAANVENLFLENITAGASYDMTLQSQSTLDGSTVSGSKLSLSITVADNLDGSDVTLTGLENYSNTLFGGSGNDMLITSNGRDVLQGGEGEDRFIFAPSSQSNELDSIVDLSIANDHIDLSAFALPADAAELDGYIDLLESGGNTTLQLFDAPAGNVIQSIELIGMSKDTLYGGTGWTSEEDILNKLLTDNTLVV